MRFKWKSKGLIISLYILLALSALYLIYKAFQVTELNLKQNIKATTIVMSLLVWYSQAA